MYGRRAGALLFAVAMVLPAAAQASPALELVAPDRKLTVGDRLTVRVNARGGAGLLWGEPKIECGPEARWSLVGKPAPVPDSEPPAWRVTLVPLAVGKLELPKISVPVRSRDGKQDLAVGTPVTVTVASVLPPDGKVKPAPLDDPVGVQGFPWEWAPPVALAAFPLVLLGLWWWLRRRRRTRSGGGVTRLAPLDELLEAVRRLEAQVGRVPPEEICDGLSGALRRFLERRTGRPALEMTSFEVRRMARERLWPEGIQRSLQEVLNVADAVRFARRRAADPTLAAAVRSAEGAAQELEAHLSRSAEAAGEGEMEGAA